MSQQILTSSAEKPRLAAPSSRAVPAQLTRGKLPPPILQLQRMLGNRRVAQLIQAKRLTSQGKIIGLQRKLTVSAADDQYEQEADRVARQVMSMPDSAETKAIEPEIPGEKGKALQTKSLAVAITPFVQRQTEVNEEPEENETPVQAKRSDEHIRLQRQPKMEEEETEHIQAKSLQSKSAGAQADSFEAGEDVESRVNQSKGGGNQLPDPVRAYMEPRFGMDFSHVRSHTGSEAIKMNRDVGAKAFTHGPDIYYGKDQSPTNLELTAHELTHVVQQTGSVPLRPKRLDDAAKISTDSSIKHACSCNSRSAKEGFSGPDSSLETKPQASSTAAYAQAKPSSCEQKTRTVNRTRNINSAPKDILQLVPNVTGLNGPAEMPAGQGSRVTLRATAARGTALTWSFVGANNGAVLGAGTARTNTLTAPAGSTGGVITVQAADAANPADVSPLLNITLVEIQQPTFALAPPPAVILPAGAAFPPNTVEASVCGNNATAAAVTAPAGRAITWSIVGNRRGATIAPATGVVTPSVRETGDIVVRASDTALPAARNQQNLTVRAHPRSISRTIRTGTTAAAGAGTYGSVYDHIFKGSGGALTGVNVSEHVFCGSDPFNFCPGVLPVLPGLPNVWTLTPAGRMVGDFMLTGAGNPGIDVNRFLPSPPNPGLPQVLTTPQILYWRSEQCGQWIPFENVPIQFILRGRRGGGFETVTINNGVAAPAEAYTGPALAAGAGPAASVCGAGERLSNMSFNPATIGADGSPLTTTAATVRVRPGGNLVTWSFPGPNFGATIVAQGNPALLGAGNIAGRVRVRAAMTATPGCFTEGRLRMREVEIGPEIRFRPATVRAGATTRATVSTKPGNRIVTWAILPLNLGAVIAGNPDNSATITAGAQVGRITVRASDQRDPTKFADSSLIIN